MRIGLSRNSNAPSRGVVESGGQGRNRTTDTRIFSPLLYQLSYLAILWSRLKPLLQLFLRIAPVGRSYRRALTKSGVLDRHEPNQSRKSRPQSSMSSTLSHTGDQPVMRQISPSLIERSRCMGIHSACSPSAASPTKRKTRRWSD